MVKEYSIIEGNKQSALIHVEQVAALSEGLEEEMNNLGMLLAEFGLDEQAIGFYEQAAKLDKKYLTPRWNLAYLFKKSDLLHAIQVFNDLAQIDPEDFRIFGELGFLLQRYDHHDLAVKNWGKSLFLNPDQPQILEALGNFKQPSIPAQTAQESMNSN